MKIVPSILNANFMELGKELEKLSKIGIKMLHLDIMDGHFVPNISFGPFLVKQISKNFDFDLDVHLMISDPGKYIPEFITDKTEYITVHHETCTDASALAKQIRSFNVKPGLSINPPTPVVEIENLHRYFDMILVMSVNPGFGGQSFMANSIPKVKTLNQWRRSHDFRIQIDGGVNADTIGQINALNIDYFVVGSYIFKSPDYKEALSKLF